MSTESQKHPSLLDLAATAAPAQRFTAQSRNHFPARRMDPVSGRALECLAHAIEHLEDEQYACSVEVERAGAEQAIALMKRLNREIFTALPALPERRSLLRLLMDRWERAERTAEPVLPAVQ